MVRSVILCAFINLLFFLALSIYPSASKEKHEFSETGFKETLSRIIPTSEFGSAVIWDSANGRACGYLYVTKR